MKASGKYRFTLQWAAENAEKVQAGEFLESLGNRKSEFIVMAVCDYIQAHPEVLTPSQKLSIIVKPSFSQEQLRELVTTIITEHLGTVPIPPAAAAERVESNSGILSMLDNLDLFV